MNPDDRDAAAATTRPGRPTATGVALAALLVVVIALGAVALARGHRTSGAAAGGATPAPVPAGPLPTPHVSVRAGITYPVALTAPLGAATDPEDRRSVEVYAADMYGSGNAPSCNEFGAIARVVRETSTAVVVATFAYKGEPGSVGYQTCMYVGSRDDRLRATERTTVRLAQPLGSRALVDARTGRQILLIGPDARPPVPSYLPDGFSSEDAEGFTATRPQAVHYYRGPAETSIEVVLQSASYGKPSGTVAGHAAVGSFYAAEYDNSYERCVGWTSDAGRYLEVCASRASRPALSFDVLARIARSLK